MLLFGDFTAATHVAHRGNHTHRDVNGGGWLRPAVFGAMDGILVNFGLLSGTAHGAASPHTVLITGMAGLVAGACSMAAGEYVSVASQRDMVLAEAAVEQRQLACFPREEQQELAALYVARGVSSELAEEFVAQLSRDQNLALDLHLREELGVSSEAAPSALVAALSSFCSFAIGAALPLLPSLLGVVSLWPAAGCALIGLFACGALVARLTVRSWWRSGLRQVVLGALAGCLTYVLGFAVGSGLG